jgi:hypothetical protein
MVGGGIGIGSFGRALIRRITTGKTHVKVLGGAPGGGERGEAKGKKRGTVVTPESTNNADSNGSLQRAIWWQPGGAFA